MKQTKIGHRLIVISRTAPATEKIACREPTNQQARSPRIVVIKDGKLVGNGPKR
jgi:hypothetical protein